MSNLKLVVVASLLTVLPISAYADPVRDSQSLVIDTEFEGGSAQVVKIDSENGFIQIMPAGNPERGWPAWWCFRIKGLAEGQAFRVSVVPSTSILPAGRPGAGRPLSAGWAMPDRAAWSSDQELWKQTPIGRRENGGITYEFTATAQDMWIAWGPMATPTMTQRWLRDAAAKHAFVETFELARTHERRIVRGIQIAAGEKPLNGRPVIWLQARQHAWESGSSWVARGISEWLAGDSPDAIWLRENTLTFVVPILDVDRAATGDGGKESTPHDHNRDWSNNPYYPEVAAVQDRIRAWTSRSRMAVFVDLHNPGPSDKRAYFYVAPDEVMDERRKVRRTAFLDTIHKTWTASIPFDRKTRSTGPSYHPLWRRISSTWVTQHGNADTVAVCLETAWNTKDSSTKGYRQVGACVAKGISRFLHSDVTRTNVRVPKQRS